MMRYALPLLILSAACTAGDRADPRGNHVTPGSACHALLTAQCGCCGDNEATCTGIVDLLVQNGTARITLSESACAREKAKISADMGAFCRSLDSVELDLACQSYPPLSCPAAGSAATGTDGTGAGGKDAAGGDTRPVD